jgi:hypothetical protein
MMKLIAPVVHWFKGLSRPVPSRDWSAVLILLIVLGVSLIGGALYFYIGIQSGAIIAPQAPPTTSPPSLSRDQLSKVIGKYQQRATNYKAGNFVSK